MSSSSDGTASPAPAPAVLTREQAIACLREGLLRLSDGEHSMCEIAARLGVFCRGFRRWPDGTFLKVWSKAMGRSTHLNRAQMELVADLWQQTEQLRLRIPIACDARTGCGPCRGWDEFSNADLERFCDEVLGRSVTVVEGGPPQTAQSAQNPVGPKGILTYRP
ncbi:MAG TPA: hypothetical protein VGH97_15990 [Thermoanaerobaculia bacterium]